MVHAIEFQLAKHGAVHLVQVLPQADCFVDDCKWSGHRHDNPAAQQALEARGECRRGRHLTVTPQLAGWEHWDARADGKSDGGLEVLMNRERAAMYAWHRRRVHVNGSLPARWARRVGGEGPRLHSIGYGVHASTGAPQRVG